MGLRSPDIVHGVRRAGNSRFNKSDLERELKVWVQRREVLGPPEIEDKTVQMPPFPSTGPHLLALDAALWPRPLHP